ncbi:MAG: hypothetical protein ACRCYZ_03955 [Alphaproteobacteria bacterium]
MLKKPTNPLKSIKNVACFVSTLAWATAVFAGEKDNLALETTGEKRAQRPLSELEKQTSAKIGKILQFLSSSDTQNLKSSGKTIQGKVTAFATRIKLKDRTLADLPFFKNLEKGKRKPETDNRPEAAKLASYLDFLPKMTEVKAIDLETYYESSLLDMDMIRVLAEKLPIGLESLNLRMKKIGDAGLEALAAKLPASIQDLYFNATDIGTRGINALAAAFPNLPNLKKLELSLNLSSEFPIEDLVQALPKAQKLTVLILDHNMISDVGVAALQAGLPKTYIKYLDLGGNFMIVFNPLKNVKGEPIEVKLH